MNRATKIQVEFNDQVEEAVENWGDHESMNLARVLRWLSQFADEHLELAIEVMGRVRYYGAANIRAMTKAIFTMAAAELTAKKFKKIAFIQTGGAGSGASTVARVLREYCRNTSFQVRTIGDLRDSKPGDYDCVVFIDDFSGTGKTLSGWWDSVEPFIRPLSASVYVGVLVLNWKARARIEGFAEGIFNAVELEDSDNVFSKENLAFDDGSKAILLNVNTQTGCGEGYEKGFGECGLLVAFRHGCPNNSIPILWCDRTNWKSLFNRRSI